MKNREKRIRNINRSWMRSWMAAALCMLFVLSCAGMGSADEAAAYPPLDTQRPVTLTVTASHPDSGAAIRDLRLTLYKVADMTVGESGAVDFTLTPEFSGEDFAQVEMNLGQYDAGGWADGAITLSGYVLAAQMPGTASAVTGEDGQASFGELSQGLYLMISSYEGSEYASVTVNPVYLTLPMYDGAGWVYDAVSKAKLTAGTLPPETEPSSERESESEEEEEETNVGVSVKKVWSGDDAAGVSARRPASITVDLLDENGIVVDTQELSMQNGWTFGWTGLTEGQWSVVEKNVPDGYSVSIQEQTTDDGKAVTITNTTPPAGVKGENRPLEPENGTDGTTPGTNNSDVKGANREKDKDAGVKGSYREGDTANVASESRLPQTGQLWWPVWLLSAVAAALVLVGLFLRLSGKRDLKS